MRIVPDDATPEDCIRAWLDLTATCEEFLLTAWKYVRATRDVDLLLVAAEASDATR